ncbi:Os10g0426450, partial [Oryza sativa Japonica Group]
MLLATSQKGGACSRAPRVMPLRSSASVTTPRSEGRTSVTKGSATSTSCRGQRKMDPNSSSVRLSLGPHGMEVSTSKKVISGSS